MGGQTIVSNMPSDSFLWNIIAQDIRVDKVLTGSDVFIILIMKIYFLVSGNQHSLDIRLIEQIKEVQ